MAQPTCVPDRQMPAPLLMCICGLFKSNLTPLHDPDRNDSEPVTCPGQEQHKAMQGKDREGEGQEEIPDSLHSFMQQIFIEHLPLARH